MNTQPIHMRIVARLTAVALPGILLTSAAAAQRSWTDDPVVAGETPVRAVHVQEIRQRIDELRRERRLPPVPYTSRPHQGDSIQTRHFTETISALAAVYREDGAELPAYGRVALDEPIRAHTINALRAAIGALEPREPEAPRSYYTRITPKLIDPGYSPQGFFPATADLDGDGNEDLIILGGDYHWIDESVDLQSSAGTGLPG